MRSCYTGQWKKWRPSFDDATLEKAYRRGTQETLTLAAPCRLLTIYCDEAKRFWLLLRAGGGGQRTNLRIVTQLLACQSGFIPRPQRTYLFKDLYKEIILRSPKKGRFFGVQVALSISHSGDQFALRLSQGGARWIAVPSSTTGYSLSLLRPSEVHMGAQMARTELWDVVGHIVSYWFICVYGIFLLVSTLLWQRSRLEGVVSSPVQLTSI